MLGELTPKRLKPPKPHNSYDQPQASSTTTSTTTQASTTTTQATTTASATTTTSAPASTSTDNPYVGYSVYLSPYYAAEIKAAVASIQDSTLAAKAAKVGRFQNLTNERELTLK